MEMEHTGVSTCKIVCIHLVGVGDVFEGDLHAVGFAAGQPYAAVGALADLAHLQAEEGVEDLGVSSTGLWRRQQRLHVLQLTRVYRGWPSSTGVMVTGKFTIFGVELCRRWRAEGDGEGVQFAEQRGD